MKQILGDNQFFGINHYDLEKGERTKNKFSSDQNIFEFITEALQLGMDGFMLNSNERGFKIIDEKTFPNTEIHYSVPYPHKFASMVNENGMLELFNYSFRQSSVSSLLFKAPSFLLTRDIKHLVSFITDLEVPKNLPKNSFIYLQNIVTDLVLGIERNDLLLEFCKAVKSKGFRPGLITLNPLLLDEVMKGFPEAIKEDLIVCFNINKKGFNVFPSKGEVENFVLKGDKKYKLMGMSIFSSGGAASIEEALFYVKKLDLDYVVYGSSKLRNIQSNLENFSAEV